MIDTSQVIIGIIVLLIAVGGLLYIFYSRTNAVEKAGYGALVMLLSISLMIPVFWIMETNGEAQANIAQHTNSVQQGAALFAQYCFQCHGTSGQGASAPKLNGNSAVNSLSDTDLLRIIDAGIPSASDPGTLQMPAWSDQYGGPLSDAQIQYLFALIRSADPTYLTKNGYPTGSGSNGFTQVPTDIQLTNPAAYGTAVAQATAGAGKGQFGSPTDDTAKTDVTIDIDSTSPTGATCVPACFATLNVKVKVGTKITWVNKSTTPHTVTAIKGLNPAQEAPDAAVFDSGIGNLIQPNDSYSYTVTAAAYSANPSHEVIYYCQIHPGMLAMITVVQ